MATVLTPDPGEQSSIEDLRVSLDGKMIIVMWSHNGEGVTVVADPGAKGQIAEVGPS